MSAFLSTYQSLFDVVLIHCGLAMSQYIVLRAGAFSLATAGLASLGAYAAGLLARDMQAGLIISLIGAAAVGLAMALLLGVVLGRVRGVYQAIATLAFVQIVLSMMFFAEDITGGPLGFNSIPKLAGTGILVVVVGVVVYMLSAINKSRLGMAFDGVRQDELVAASLGIAPAPLHILAFALSGAIAGLFGGLIALHSYSLEPTQFGFHLLVSVLAMVVLGGRLSVWGPIAGAVILTTLPEIARPLSENRMLVHGLLLIIIIIFLPRGIIAGLGQLFFAVAKRRPEVRPDVAST
jgi:branched-chain amino acid transport system permease protein